MKHNKADILRQDGKDLFCKDQSNMNLKIAGFNLKPLGFEYQGSASVHYYRKFGSDDFTFIVQLIGFKDIEEGQADLGWKEMKKSLMKLFGREDKRRTDTKEEII